MDAAKFTAFGLILALSSAVVCGADEAQSGTQPLPKQVSATLAAAQATAERAIEDAATIYDTAVLDAKKRLREAVASAFKAALQRADLEQANTLDALRKKLDAEIDVLALPREARWAVGQWNVGVVNGATLVFTISADRTAKKSNTPDATGKWVVNDNGVYIVWSDGWSDVLQLGDGGVQKFAYKPGTHPPDRPDNTANAVRVEEQQAAAQSSTQAALPPATSQTAPNRRRRPGY